MASLGGQQENYSNNPAVENTPKRAESREGSAERKASKDREEKLKYARDRQNEERQRKIEELRAQAEAAQRYREQKEEERRRRIEELRVRDTEKRHQVEERKKAIIEAEKERREYILKKNQERESRIETKKRDRNSIGFAFGSSTPRLLDVPADYGLVSPSAFWGQRRSTSISNVAGASLSRRSSERELADSGAKKRASSSTDRHDGSRSGNVTPGGHLNNSRPGSAMSTSTTMSTSGFVARRPATAPRKARPASIAGTGMSLEEINKAKREHKPPVKTTAASPSSTSTAQTTPKRTANLMSTSLIVTSSTARLSSAEKKTPTKRDNAAPRSASASKALPTRTASSERIHRVSKDVKTKDTSAAMAKSMLVANTVAATASAAGADENGLVLAKESVVEKEAEKTNAPVAPAQTKAEKEALNSEEVAEQALAVQAASVPAGIVMAEPEAPAPATLEEKVDEGSEKDAQQQKQAESNPPSVERKPSRHGSKENSEVRELTPPASNSDANDLMTASMIARKITTEEEAKAALAERRRLAREEAERQAELERQRLEAERRAELKRQEEEAERQRQFEEEATRLAQEQRRAEEERLRKAIEETKQREEEEQRRREDEERQRVEREETEKKAKEEAEKQRVEVAERLKREEKEREERRKRVEAIMSRTRKGGAAGGGTPTATPAKESNDSGKSAPASKENEASSESGSNSSSNSAGSPSNAAPAAATEAPTVAADQSASNEPPNTQAMYEQSVLDKENSLINSFSSMIIDENAKNLQPFEVSNGKLHGDFNTSSATNTAVANGNGHIENVNNKNDINLLQDVVTPATAHLIDLSIESQDLHNNPLNINNNNSLLTTTTATNTLVTADSHENKDISLL